MFAQHQLFTARGAPSPCRVAFFLAEKGVTIPTREVSLRDGEHYGEALASLNPDRTVPFLVLDDGGVVCESIAICRYVEACAPSPSLFGESPAQQGHIEMWLRILEIQGYLPVQDAYRNTRRGFAGRALPGRSEGCEQIPALAERANAVYARTLARLDAALDERPYVAGSTFSMADIVAFTTLVFAQRTRMEVALDLEDWPALEAWRARVDARPAAPAGA